MPKKIGDSCIITGGAESSPKVEVTRYLQPGSLHHGDITLRIVQDGHYVHLSPNTLQDILTWYKRPSV